MKAMDKIRDFSGSADVPMSNERTKQRLDQLVGAPAYRDKKGEKRRWNVGMRCGLIVLLRIDFATRVVSSSSRSDCKINAFIFPCRDCRLQLSAFVIVDVKHLFDAALLRIPESSSRLV